MTTWPKRDIPPPPPPPPPDRRHEYGFLGRHKEHCYACVEGEVYAERRETYQSEYEAWQQRSAERKARKPVLF